MRQARCQRLILCGVLAGVSCAGLVARAAGQVIEAAGAASSTSAPASGPSSAAAEAGPALLVVYFHSPTCEECRQVKQALPGIVGPWGARVRLVETDALAADGLRDLLLYGERYGVKLTGPPVVFVGGRCLAGARGIVAALAGAIAEELKAGSATFVPASQPSPPAGQGAAAVPEGVRRRFAELRGWAVIAAGLLDGVNPCAFTTIVFLVSMVAYLGRGRRELAVVGVGFTLTVFATYFLLGLGLLESVKAFSVSRGISRALAWAVGLLAFALAGWSLLDAVRYLRSGDVKTVTLRLPGAVRSAIHRVIRAGLSVRGLAAGSVAVGFLVTLLESVCTGQVYLPTLVLVARDPALRPAAVGYLLLYNLMFILPLVGILTAAYLGVRSQRLGEFLRRHLVGLKLAMGVLFAGLGALVLWTA